MRIAQISTPQLPTLPVAFGGSELVAGHLTEELVRRGHDVTLFASEESRSPVRLVSFAEASRASSFDQRELVHVANALRFAHEFDVIHNHCLAAGLALARLSPVPVVSILHYVPSLVYCFPDHNYVAVSQRQKELAAGLNVRAVVHNAIDPSKFKFEGSKDDYLLFLGRFHHKEGVHLAIDLALRMSIRLVIAAPLPPPDQQNYFEELIRPRLGNLVEYVGEVKGDVKINLLARAKALVMTLFWDEPFGLVLLEAMASGTPVVALSRGSIPEIVIDGQTGFVVDSVEDMAAAVESVGEITAADCRAQVERNSTIGGDGRQVSGRLQFFVTGLEAMVFASL